MFGNFTVSDWIQFVGVIVSMFVGIASIIIAVVTLRQNSKMIAESSRPYVVVSFERTFQRLYFVIKNYGQTGAYINKFDCLTGQFKEKLQSEKMTDQIEAIEGTFLAPGQKLCLVFFMPFDIENVVFNVEYSASKKKYVEIFSLHIPLKLPVSRGHTSRGGQPDHLKDISNCMQEMVERKF